MKILHIASGNGFGGIETFLIALGKLRYLCPQIEHHFALGFEGKLSQILRRNGESVHLLGDIKVRKIWTVWRSQHHLKQLVKQEDFDLIICHAIWSQALFGAGMGKPSVFWSHDAVLNKHWLEGWARFVKPSLAIANSQYTLSYLQNFYPHTPSHLVLYPVTAPKLDPDSYDQIQILNTRSEKVVIIQVSRLEPYKGHALLLAALGKLKDLKTWECWIVGGVQSPQSKIYLEELKDQAQNLGIMADVKFLGERSDVPNLLRAADIHCQPNIKPEPFGISFIEALYAGLPVVTTNIGGGAEIVDSTCGVLVAPDNVMELSLALRSLIDNQALREHLGSHGFARAVQLCDPAQQINQLWAILQPLVK